LDINIVKSIVLKLGPVWRADPGLESGWIEEKTGEEKLRCDPADPAG